MKISFSFKSFCGFFHGTIFLFYTFLLEKYFALFTSSSKFYSSTTFAFCWNSFHFFFYFWQFYFKTNKVTFSSELTNKMDSSPRKLQVTVPKLSLAVLDEFPDLKFPAKLVAELKLARDLKKCSKRKIERARNLKKCSKRKIKIRCDKLTSDDLRNMKSIFYSFY